MYPRKASVKKKKKKKHKQAASKLKTSEYHSDPQIIENLCKK